jgi:hypothetical protein
MWCLKIIGDDSSPPATADAYEEVLDILDTLRQTAIDEAALQILPSVDDLRQGNVSQIDNALVGRYKRMIGLGNRTFFKI